MNLELRIVKEAGAERCRVQLVGEAQEAELAYSGPMREYGVKVQSGGLVAVDVDANEVVYRVARLGEVESVDKQRLGVSIRDAAGSLIAGFEAVHNVGRAEGLHTEVAVGDRVYFTAGDKGQIFDVVVDEQPSTPNASGGWCFRGLRRRTRGRGPSAFT